MRENAGKMRTRIIPNTDTFGSDSNPTTTAIVHLAPAKGINKATDHYK